MLLLMPEGVLVFALFYLFPSIYIPCTLNNYLFGGHFPPWRTGYATIDTCRCSCLCHIFSAYLCVGHVPPWQTSYVAIATCGCSCLCLLYIYYTPFYSLLI